MDSVIAFGRRQKSREYELECFPFVLIRSTECKYAFLFRHRKKKFRHRRKPGCKKGAVEAQSCTTEGFAGVNLSLQAIIVRIASFTEESFLTLLISVPRRTSRSLGLMFLPCSCSFISLSSLLDLNTFYKHKPAHNKWVFVSTSDNLSINSFRTQQWRFKW